MTGENNQECLSQGETNKISDLKNTINEYFKPVYDQSNVVQENYNGLGFIGPIPKEFGPILMVVGVIYLIHEIFIDDKYLKFHFSDIKNKIQMINNNDITSSYQLWSKIFIKRSLLVFLAKLLYIFYIIVMPLLVGYYIFLVSVGIVIGLCIIIFIVLLSFGCVIIIYNELDYNFKEFTNVMNSFVAKCTIIFIKLNFEIKNIIIMFSSAPIIAILLSGLIYPEMRFITLSFIMNVFEIISIGFVFLNMYDSEEKKRFLDMINIINSEG